MLRRKSNDSIDEIAERTFEWLIKYQFKSLGVAISRDECILFKNEM